MKRSFLNLLFLMVPVLAGAQEFTPWTLPGDFPGFDPATEDPAWPGETPESRPGSYWWWPGSAVTMEGITWNMETYQKAGWGNLGVIGIYGVKGMEKLNKEVFSREWFRMYNHAVAEGERLGLNIDLTPSSGWRMGGPHVTPEYQELLFHVEQDKIRTEKLNAMVKRAGPGGTGLCINPYSISALTHHLEWLDMHFRKGKGKAPRAFYYDSFENRGNWCPEFLDGFRRLRGYSLENYIAELGGEGDPEVCRRVMCDYRETLSDLLLESVDKLVHWSAEKGSRMRIQAHGAPANLLDMYGMGGIPETEVFGGNHFHIPGFRRDSLWTRPDKHSALVNRFASSAAHVEGHSLVISESFTWMRNHYHGALSQIKAESDLLFLNGINGIYYHGSCYAPPEAPWPGWLFYASTQMNYRNSIFRDVPVLNKYITRSQAMFQSGRADNEILLYWPVYDLWMSTGERELRFTVHETDWLEDSPCGAAANWMLEEGYTFDFISDKQILETTMKDGLPVTSGGIKYRTILLPPVKYMPLSTLRKLRQLADEGVSILVWKTLPGDVPGLKDAGERKAELNALVSGMEFDARGVARLGDGRFIWKKDLQELMDLSGVEREILTDLGLKFFRLRREGETVYFVVNHKKRPVDGWVDFARDGSYALIMDPMHGNCGTGLVNNQGPRTSVYLRLLPGETRFICLSAKEYKEQEPWPVYGSPAGSVTVEGPWSLEFTEGGPVIPAPATMDTLVSWTGLEQDGVESFAGAASYSSEFIIHDAEGYSWILDLGDVRESARVWVNGEPAGVLVAHPYSLDVTSRIKSGTNCLEIEVTNLAANRIRDLDRKGVKWRIFEDINFVSHMYTEFDASQWPLKPSGLLGPVKIMRLKGSDRD